ncbi:MAG: hypothetical protein Q7S65_00425 [Nanoarchaeota archaeon]|nr:hypothetical protein [Nanoarchaeota archaeon]
MNRRWILGLLFLGLLALTACKNEQYLLCPDGVTQVVDLAACPPVTSTCPLDCDDSILCTSDFCNAETQYLCAHRDLIPCHGNGKCEQGEFPGSDDCPKSCNDNNACTTDGFRYETNSCYHDEILPCCGNGKCDAGETFVACSQDCVQSVDINVIKFEKRQRIEGAGADLSRTDFTYLIVRFTIHNLNIDRRETLDFKTKDGYLYDPYKVRLEDSRGNLYNVEYDSELLEDWLDPTIVPLGNTVTALVVFIIPTALDNARLVAYDKFGARLDSSTVY